jgi:hydroxypyruvate isomerase
MVIRRLSQETPMTQPTRRAVLASAALASIAACSAGAAGENAPAAPSGVDLPPVDYKTSNNRIRQSIMGWTYSPMPVPEIAKHCKEIGLIAMEGIGKEHYPMIKDAGLQVSLVGSHGFTKGPVNPAYHPACEKALLDGIDLAVAVGCKRVITFTGMKEKTIDADQSAKNCVDLWKKVIGHAEKQKVEICLEHLNSRDHTHPMKGHPGYFGDHVDFCVELINRVGSPNMKLLFDIYHVQIMDGDVIRRIRQYKDVIAHVHTAGVPGRGELTAD